jgi:hypothetical protein
VAATPAVDDDAVLLDEPLRLRTGLDITADLTSVLATRMKPPPKPRRDLRPTTALWILATGAALVLLGYSLATATDLSAWVFGIGAAELVIGYVWVTRVAFCREVRRGLLCAIPPLTLWYLGQWKYARFRPLRFAATGAALMGLAWLAPFAERHTRTWAGVPDPSVPPPQVVEVTARPKLDQLRYYQEQRQYDALIALLRTLARTDPQYSDESKNRVEIAAELRRLATSHPDTGVKAEALTAYAAWGGADARELCLKALESPSREERLTALRLLPKWKDESVARRIAERIGRAGTESTAAQDALVALGGPLAERAAIPLLRKDDQGVRLTAIEILGNDNVGGPAALAALREAARTSPDPGTRQPAASKADQLEARLKK